VAEVEVGSEFFVACREGERIRGGRGGERKRGQQTDGLVDSFRIVRFGRSIGMSYLPEFVDFGEETAL
jgi:hypothetical protein